ncbi:MAG: toll/interleukin-1 receptor domain-containing protein [Flavobacterium sp.]|nr:MAG: toll/interleukin-1 receptor domain-containing protein [Flavobacterium sp.]
MKVFISWSGEVSRNIAEILKQWLPNVIQAIKPYYSPDDISKGSRWSSDIAQELEDSRIGVICLTKDNWQSPWINFEAGALSKNIDKAKVVPLLFGLEPTEITGPLVQFQAAQFNKVEMLKMIQMINSELETSLGIDVINRGFGKWWPDLESSIQKEIKKSIDYGSGNRRDQRDMLEEALTILRNISNQNLSPIHGDLINSKFLFNVTDTWNKLIQAYIKSDRDLSYKALLDLYNMFNFLINSSNTVMGTREKFSDTLKDALLSAAEFYEKFVKSSTTKNLNPKLSSLDVLRQKITETRSNKDDE